MLKNIKKKTIENTHFHLGFFLLFFHFSNSNSLVVCSERIKRAEAIRPGVFLRRPKSDVSLPRRFGLDFNGDCCVDGSYSRHSKVTLICYSYNVVIL